MSIKLLTKEIIAFILYKLDQHNIWSFRPRNDIPLVLYYHRVCDRSNDLLSSPDLIVYRDNFAKQMKFLKENFNVVSLDDIARGIIEGNKVSRRDIAITFDDGYVDNYTHAFPILKDLGLPATIFLTTEYIGTARLFWWDKLGLIFKEMKGKEVNWRSFPLDLFSSELIDLFDSALQRKEKRTPLTNYLKKIGIKGRSKIIEFLEEKFIKGTDISPSDRLFLSWDEIKEMSFHNITFGSHSHSHSILTETENEEVIRELIVSRNLIKNHTGINVTAFSYPDGSLNERTKNHVIDVGYKYAVQTNRKSNMQDFDMFSIPRKMVKERHSRGYIHTFSEAMFTMELSGTASHIYFRDSRRNKLYDS